jgi:hypothetical protein
MNKIRSVALAVIPAALLALAAVALAAPPSNDNREDAAAVAIPSTTTGTTEESTREANEPGFNCGSPAGTVWYRVDIPADGRINASIKAQGELSASVEILRRQRNAVTAQDCDVTDEEGNAATSVRVKQGEGYLIRVAQQAQSVPGQFELDVQFEAPTPRAPGAKLPRRGASGRLDPVLRPAAAYSTTFREGRPYRINLDSGSETDEGCEELQVFGPGTRDFDDDEPLFTIGCQGYKVFTPGPGDGGRHSLVVRANRDDEGSQPFRLQVAPAGGDDIAPGVFIRNYASKRGSVSARGADVVDLYRFDVTRRSDLDLVLDTDAGLDLQLLRESGGRLRCACDGTGGRIRVRVGRGRYFAAVRAQRGESGSYTLRRVSRTITRTSIAINGRRRSTVRPGRTVPITAHVSPGVAGPVTIVVYRFDPIEGWRYSQRFRRNSRSGTVSAPLHLSQPGRWRARAVFHGTRAASESRTRYAFITAEAPLQQRR